MAIMKPRYSQISGKRMKYLGKLYGNNKNATFKPSKQKIQFASQLRSKMTPAELYLWQQLSKLQPVFQPQAIVWGYIADFCAEKYKLIVEVDGPIHDSQKDYDMRRDSQLREHRYKILRFTNDYVMQHRSEVLAQIIEAL